MYMEIHTDSVKLNRETFNDVTVFAQNKNKNVCIPFEKEVHFNILFKIVK